MSRINPRTMDDFEAIEIDGMQFGWTQFRIDKSKLPKGVHAYDVMYDDDEGDNPFMIKQDVAVDFMGSVISRDELPSNSIWIDKEQMVRYVEDLENWTYLDGIYTYPEMLRRLKKGYVFNQSKYRRKKNKEYV